MIAEQRIAVHLPELVTDEFVKFRQSHEPTVCSDPGRRLIDTAQPAAATHNSIGSATADADAAARSAACR